MKIKLSNVLRLKERNKRKNRYAKLNIGKEDLYIYYRLTARGKEQYEKQT